VDCVFDEDGMLASWHGHEDEERTRIWSVRDPSDTFQFQIQSDPVTVTKVKLPHLIVNDNIVFPSNMCFEAWQRSPQSLSFPSDDLWTFSPAANDCGDGPYLLTISIQDFKSGSVDPAITQNPQSGRVLSPAHIGTYAPPASQTYCRLWAIWNLHAYNPNPPGPKHTPARLWPSD
jgi:hypothetical protein